MGPEQTPAAAPTGDALDALMAKMPAVGGSSQGDALDALIAKMPAAPQRPSDTLPPPHVVDAQTTANARVYAEAATRPPGAPGPAAPPALPPIQAPGLIDSLMVPFTQGGVSKQMESIRGPGARMKPSPNEPSAPGLETPAVDFTQWTPQPGVARGVAEFASGLTSPENLMVMGATSGLGLLEGVIGRGLVSRMVSLGFSGQMLHQAYQETPALRDAWNKEQWPQVRQILTRMLLSGAMAAMAARHAGSPEPKAAPEATPTMVRDAQQPAGAPYANNDALTRLSEIETDPRKRALIEQAARDREIPVGAPERWAASSAETLQHAPEPAAPAPQPEAKPAPPPAPGPAEQSAAVFERARETQERQAAAKRAKQNVAVPETGIPEGVARGVDARERIAHTLTGKTFGELDPRDQIAIDDLIGEMNSREGSRAKDALDPLIEQAPPIPTKEKTHEPVTVEPRPKPEPAVQKEARPKAAEIVPPAVAEPGAAGGERPAAPAHDAGAPAPVAAPVTPPPAPIEPRTPGRQPHYGRNVAVAVPGEDTSYAARYAIRDASDVHPSHNAFNFGPNPEFEYQNDRDYRTAANAARVAEQAAPGKFNPEFVATESPTAEHGPPVVDPRGNVLGGNSRAMTLARTYGSNPEGAEAYKSALRDRAASFGLDPAAVDSYPRPVLTRELVDQPDKATAQKAITDFNKTGAAALSPAERAVADGKRLSRETVSLIASRLEDVGEGSTLAQAMRGDGGGEIVNALVRDGVVTQQEANGLVDERGELTPAAKDRIAKMLTGRMFESPEQFAQTPPELRNKLDRVAPHVLRVEGRAGWELTPQLREALGAIGEARAHGIKNFSDLANQPDLNGELRSYSPDALAIAKVLNNGPVQAAASFRRYANDEALSRDNGQSAFFAPPSRAEAFEEAFDAPFRGHKAGQRGSISPELLTLGAEKFWTDDVAPAIHDAASTVAEAGDDILKVLAPTLRSPSAQKAGLIMRNRMAELARRSDRAEASLKQAKRAFDRLTPEQNFDFIARVEAGRAQPAPELDRIAGVLRSMLDGRRADVQALGKGKLQSFYENYFPHIWKKPQSAAEAFATFFGRRPLEGPKSFLKKRTHITFEDGLQAGLKPVTDNAVELALLKVREMDRYIVAHQTLADWKQSGLARFVDARNGKVPAGWTKIDDPIGAVYGPSIQRIDEFPNEGTWRGLQDVANALGLRQERGFLNMRGAVGRAQKGTGRVSTLHGTAEDVLAHEIGHQIDWLAGSGRRFVLDYPDAATAARLKRAYATLRDVQGTTPDQRAAARQELKGMKSAIAQRKQFAQELRDLADLRGGRKDYTHKREEKMAQLAEMWVGSRELFRRTAPTVYGEWRKFLDENPKLHALRDIEGNTEVTPISQPYDVGGLVIRGNYYAPEGATRILSNYLTPGLRAHGAYRALLGANNVLNQFQLGASGFHAGFTSAETVVSKGALGVEQILRGRPVAAVKSFASMPAAPVQTFLTGSKVLREWYAPGSEGAPIAAIVDALEKGGGRARMDRTYQTDIGEHMMRAFRRGNLLGGLARAPFAGVEAMSNLIMKELVPRQKLGVFADLARLEMERLGPGATVEQTRDAMAKAWDSVENRLGEMTYDNLFWDRTAKDLAMLSVRSVGWNLGTIREIGGAAIDAARLPARLARGEDVNLHRMAYVISLATTGAAMGAIYQYLATGHGPQELKDYYFPRTGQLDEAGRPQRMALPLYIKDVYHYATDPGKTLSGKSSPLVDLMAEMIRNEDFYGAKIRNEDDPLVKQMRDELMHVASSAVPLSVRNLERETGLGAPISQRAQQFAGITPAPAELERTAAERLAYELAGSHMPDGGRTSEEAERSRLKSELTRSLRLKRGVPAEVAAARKAGTLTVRDLRTAVAESRQAPLARAFARLGVEDAIKVYRAADAGEKRALRPALLKKARAAIDNQPPEAARRILAALKSALLSK